MNDKKPIIDYSSPAIERSRAHSAENERRQAIETYNESSLGEPRPIASAFLRIALPAAALTFNIFLLPKSISDPLTDILIIVYLVWEFARTSWHPKRSLRHPWRNW